MRIDYKELRNLFHGRIVRFQKVDGEILRIKKNKDLQIGRKYHHEVKSEGNEKKLLEEELLDLEEYIEILEKKNR